MSKTGKSNEASRVRQLITGTNKHFPNGSQQLTVGGVAYTVTALTALLQSFVDSRDAVDAAKAAASAKIAAENARAPSLRGVVSAFVAYVRATYGNSPDVLVDFGLSLHKARTPLTADQKAAAVAKTAATRAARHVMGKNQRKAVKAPVQVTITSTPLADPLPIASPPAAPVAPAAPPSPPAGNTPTGSAPTGNAAGGASPPRS
jgi:hypothetical protein